MNSSQTVPARRRIFVQVAGLALAASAAVIVLLMLYWSNEPELFDVREVTAQRLAAEDGVQDQIGVVTVATLMATVETLLDKPGGYLTNDVSPPGLLMDNMPNWEWGVLRQARDLARALRNDISRSQTQSAEDADLATAETSLHVDSEAWVMPRAESEYRHGAVALGRYLKRLRDTENPSAQFYARADNLHDWLEIVERRLGDLSQRLSACVGQVRVNTDLGGDTAARQTTEGPSMLMVKTPWYQVDDVLYEARGSTWALIHYLRAVEVDFAGVLEKKNALVSLRQIIRELEGTQEFIWSPIVLNGTGFGLVANHSLVMASYISRAHAAVTDLRTLLSQG
ncbi:MAG: DUF2333 family protein [Gammaproteobacteria bacterium]|nr:DUF2333 family protein [Gammaproteobacteria bacterium]